MIRAGRAHPGTLHYAWLVVVLVFLTLLAAAAVRASPGVLIVPLEQAFGWSPATISLAISLNLLLYGLMGPFAGALMQRFGIRRTVIGGLVLADAGVVLSCFMVAPWQLVATWGLLVGAGCGAVALVFGATVVNRWFVARRGLAMGIVTASSATGQLVFLPLLAGVATGDGWRPAVWIVAAALGAMIGAVWLLLPERPADVGARAYGETGAAPPAPPAAGNPLAIAFATLGRGVKSRDFWLLFATFFVCGASANGLVGAHLISYCFDNGIPEVRAAWLLAAMGAFNIVGTTASGWLSDRYDNRVLLMLYYGLRGVSLLYLPYSDFSFATLGLFAIFYGLDWIATVPPTLRLITERFGKSDAPVVFGWVFAGHQVGAGAIALIAGALRTELGSYVVPFLLSGLMCLAAALLVLGIGRTHGPGRLVAAGAVP